MSTSGTKKITKRKKNALRIRFDVGWVHGINIDNNGKKVKCKYCIKLFSRGIYRFKHHLAAGRVDSSPCPSFPNNVKVIMLETVMELGVVSMKKRQMFDIENSQDDCSQAISKGKGIKLQVRSTQSTINQMFKKNLREEVN